MEVANLIVNILTAIGTVGAVIVSLVLSQKKEQPNIKVMNGYVEMSKKEFYAICIFNNDISKSYSIKEIGYADKLAKKWVNIDFSKLQCKKKDYNKIIDGHYKVVECYLNKKFEYGQELHIILTPKQIENLINSNKRKTVKIAIILLGENKIWIKVSKKLLKQYI